MGQGTPHPRDLTPHDSLPALRPTQALFLPPTCCHSSFKHSRIQSPWLPLSGKASSCAQDEGILILHGTQTPCPLLRQDTRPTADGDGEHVKSRPAERNLHASTPAPEAASSACCLSNPNARGPPHPCGHTTAKLLGGLQTGRSAIRQGWRGEVRVASGRRAGMLRKRSGHNVLATRSGDD